MEEILASIRRIISDEVAAEPVPAPPIPARYEPSRPPGAREPSFGRETAPNREYSSSREPSPGREPAGRTSSPTSRESVGGSSAPPARPVPPALAPLRSREPAPSTYAPLRPAASAGQYPSASSAEAPISYAPSGMPVREPSGGAVNYVPPGRAPAVDPFAPRPRSLSAAAPLFSSGSAARAVATAAAPAYPPIESRPVEARRAEAAPRVEPRLAVRPAAPAESDLDKPLAAALLDLALVEQAVQAELANVSAEAIASKPVATEAIEPAVAAGGELGDAARNGAESAADEGSRRESVQAESVKAESLEVETGTVDAPIAADAAEPVVAVASADAAPVAMPSPVMSAPAPAEEVPSAPVKDEAAPVARPATTATRSEARLVDARPFEARMEARLAESRLADNRLADTRLTESRLAESRLVLGSRQSGNADQAAPETTRERLVSAPAGSAVSAAFGSLHRSVNSNSRTVDDLVSEALRPMLKAWLDENLPALVERLVRAEIERVARQGQ